MILRLPLSHIHVLTRFKSIPWYLKHGVVSTTKVFGDKGNDCRYVTASKYAQHLFWTFWTCLLLPKLHLFWTFWTCLLLPKLHLFGTLKSWLKAASLFNTLIKIPKQRYSHLGGGGGTKSQWHWFHWLNSWKADAWFFPALAFLVNEKSVRKYLNI